MIRELIWQYPFAFIVTFCVSATVLCVVGVALCFSIPPNKDDQ